MKVRHALFALLVVLTIAAPADAHRLDEYLQATRLRLEPNQIVLEIDLTPGSSIASDVIALVDRDGDRVISPAEAAAYGDAVIAEIVMEVDGRATPITLSQVEASSPGDLAEGVGTIQLTAQTDAPHGLGRHRVRVSNLHRPDGSVYLANALLPQTQGIRILEQRRDVRQQTFALEYEVRAVGGASQLMWLFSAGASLTSLALARLRLRRTTICAAASPR